MRNPVAPLGNDELLAHFQQWLMSSDRSEGTIALRMRHAVALGRDVPLSAATVDDLEAVLRVHRHLAPETRKSMLSSWRVLFGWARRRGIRVDDPTLDLGGVRVPVRVPRVAPDDDIELAIERATPQVRAMILLARYGCLRLTELTTLHFRDRELDLLRVLGKGDKERMVGINEPLMLALEALEERQEYGFYFPGRGMNSHMHPQSVHKIIVRETGWNPHSLRHAGATAAYNATKDLRAVQAMLGHASLATTQRYLHLDADALRRVAAATIIPSRSLINT
jgi:site-specific recombinase XerD